MSHKPYRCNRFRQLRIHRGGRLTCADDVGGLIEWLDVASFIRSDTGSRSSGDQVSMRDLYESVLGYIRGMERQGYNVLSGVLNFPIETIPDWRVAILYVSDKKSDPSGQKRQYIPVDTSHFSKKVTLGDSAWWFGDD